MAENTPTRADFAWEVLLRDALGVGDDADHASGPSDLLPLVRWAVEDVQAFQAGLERIQEVIEAVPAHAWEDGQSDGDPLWEALDQIDEIVTGVGTGRSSRRSHSGSSSAPPE